MGEEEDEAEEENARFKMNGCRDVAVTWSVAAPRASGLLAAAEECRARRDERALQRTEARATDCNITDERTTKKREGWTSGCKREGDESNLSRGSGSGRGRERE